jgi:hypothetical protein
MLVDADPAAAIAAAEGLLHWLVQIREFLGNRLRRAGTSEPSRTAGAGATVVRLSVDRIVREPRIPVREASARIRTVYRNLGVRSRRTTVAVAYELGLLRLQPPAPHGARDLPAVRSAPLAGRGGHAGTLRRRLMRSAETPNIAQNRR